VAEPSTNTVQFYLKIGLIVLSVLFTLFCLLGSVGYDIVESHFSGKIMDFRTHNLGLDEAKILASTDGFKKAEDTARQRSETLFELFTHVMTGFFGIALASLADLVGARVDVALGNQGATGEGAKQ
jgi:hypothetical protein